MLGAELLRHRRAFTSSPEVNSSRVDGVGFLGPVDQLERDLVIDHLGVAVRRFVALAHPDDHVIARELEPRERLDHGGYLVLGGPAVLVKRNEEAELLGRIGGGRRGERFGRAQRVSASLAPDCGSTMFPSVIAVAGASAPGGISAKSLAGSAQLTWPAASARTAASGCGVGLGLVVVTPESPVETGCASYRRRSRSS